MRMATCWVLPQVTLFCWTLSLNSSKAIPQRSLYFELQQASAHGASPLQINLHFDFLLCTKVYSSKLCCHVLVEQQSDQATTRRGVGLLTCLPESQSCQTK